MKLFILSTQKLAPARLTVWMTLVFLVGIALSACLTSESQWVNWSFSALGERGELSSFIFNIAIAMMAVIMWCLAESMSDVLEQAEAVATARLSLVALRTIAFCGMAIAIFPNDTQHGLHYIFSRLSIIVFAFYAFMLPFTTSLFTRQQKSIMLGLSVAAVMACVQGFVHREFSFVVYEAAAGGLGALWFYLTSRFTQQAVQTSATTLQSSVSQQKAS
jgi:hypothetical protein cdiviTM7_00788